MDISFQGLSVLVTRPLPQGLMLCQQIEARGGTAHYFPTISFTPAVNQAEFKNAVANLAEQDWLIFISPRAVTMSLPIIKKMMLSAKTKFAAVGEGTAKALEKAGFHAVYPMQQAGSDGLLALPEFQSVQDQKMTIIKGAGGREILARTLNKRGAMVHEVIAYQRELPVVSPMHSINLFKKKEINLIVCSSFEGVSNFKRLMGDDTWVFIKNIPLLVVSDRIKVLAEKIGFTNVRVATGASNQAILHSLVEHDDDR